MKENKFKVLFKRKPDQLRSNNLNRIHNLRQKIIKSQERLDLSLTDNNNLVNNDDDLINLRIKTNRYGNETNSEIRNKYELS